MPNDELVIEQTKKWIKDVVIGCNFCPFAAKEMRQNKIHFKVAGTKSENGLDLFLKECRRLEEDRHIETSLLIFPDSYQHFYEYLDMLSIAERLLKKNGYEGIFQVASFHPLYCFEGSNDNDAANFTNRSPYPMLHILREEGIEQALLRYPHPEKIPENNITFARAKGFAYMNLLRDACLNI